MRISRTLFAVATLVVAGQTAHAQAIKLATASTDASMTVADINTLRFEGTVSLDITSGTAGSALPVATATSSYDIISNATNSKLTAELDQVMPEGATLTVVLGAPAGATAASAKSLTASAVDVVTGISNVSETGLSVDYTFAATVKTPKSFTRTVKYVLTPAA